jgi:hypothetical protein
VDANRAEVGRAQHVRLFANVVLIVLSGSGAISGVVWDGDATARTTVVAVFWLGCALVLVTTFLLNH